MATTIFITNNLPNVHGLILSGPSLFKNKLAQSDLLDKRLKSIILSCAYGSDAGLNQAIKLSQEILENVKYVKEKNFILFFYQLLKNTNILSYGIHDTNGIVWDGLQIQRYIIKDNHDQEQIIYTKLYHY